MLSQSIAYCCWEAVLFFVHDTAFVVVTILIQLWYMVNSGNRCHRRQAVEIVAVTVASTVAVTMVDDRDEGTYLCQLILYYPRCCW